MSAGPRGRDGVPEWPSCKYPASKKAKMFGVLESFKVKFILVLRCTYWLRQLSIAMLHWENAIERGTCTCSFSDSVVRFQSRCDAGCEEQAIQVYGESETGDAQVSIQVSLSDH